MLDGVQSFIPLPGEQILWRTPPRTTLALSTPNKFPGKEPLSIHSGSGTAHLTNQRVCSELLLDSSSTVSHISSFSLFTSPQTLAKA